MSDFWKIFLSALLVAGFSSLGSYALLWKQFTKTDKEKSYNPLIESIFKPFHYSLERKLFHKLVVSISSDESYQQIKSELESLESNKPKFKIAKIYYRNKAFSKRQNLKRFYAVSEMRKTINELNQEIKNKNLEFLLSDSFITYLDSLLSSFIKYDQDSSSKNLEKVNYNFKKFSTQYFLELKFARKSIGLKDRSTIYRSVFGMYSNKLAFHFKQWWGVYLFIVLYPIFIFLLNNR